MKKVIVIGGNGRTARRTIPRLLEQNGVKVTLFVRRRGQVADLAAAGMSVVEGDAHDRDALTRALTGQDIAIVTLGGEDMDQTTAHIVDAADAAGVGRIITVNAGGIYDELPEPFNSWDRRQLGAFRGVLRRAADVVEESRLRYTVLRPVWLTDDDDTGYELTVKGEIFRGTETSRTSIAAFIASLVEHPDTHVNESIGISTPGTDADRPAAYR